MGAKYDFSGYATRNDIRCSDGRTIRKDAFKDCDGKTVPLVWQHMHDDPGNVLGHALLENREDGVYTYGVFNDTESGKNAKELVDHGDVTGLSIYANKLKQKGGDVLHGQIREVSLVLAGANPGAFIDYIDDSMAHSDDLENGEAIIYSDEEDTAMELFHAEEVEEKIEEAKTSEEQPELEHEDKSEGEEMAENEKTVQDVFYTLTEEQKTVVYALIGQALEDAAAHSDDDDEENTMKHNLFDEEKETEGGFLSHAEIQNIFNDAKKCGSLKEAVNNAIESGVLAHSIDTTGMETAVGEQTYGFNDASMLFSDYKALSNTPEWISRNMDWVQKVMGSVHHTPFSRIKSIYADITEDDARAKGYIKGKQKKEEVFTTLKRTTSPQTIYKKQKMDRDDIVDITDFDVVAWIRSEMRLLLNEEIARAILIGDGRASDSDDKIAEANVRPIVNDVPLFNIQHAVEVPADATPAEIAEALMDETVRARKGYKGSGNPTFFTTEDQLTEMLLLKDGVGHKLYKSEPEVATALRAREVVTVEPMEGHTIKIGDVNYELLGVLVNLADYNVGADKGGAINMFDDFDIDYNQYKYLIETRISGALIKPFSAITLYKKVVNG